MAEDLSTRLVRLLIFALAAFSARSLSSRSISSSFASLSRSFSASSISRLRLLISSSTSWLTPPSPPSFLRSSSISLCCLLMSADSLTTSLTVALLHTRLALTANRRVLWVSSACAAAGVTLHTMAVLELPPSAGCRIRVSFESRNGMCEPLPSAPSVSLLMTMPRFRRDLLMLAPSFMRIPSAPVLSTRSDPARSTRLSLPTLNDCRSSAWPASSVSLEFSTMTMNTACDRDDSSFMRVAPVVLCDAPRSIRP
mmetsp:Transcript_8589/g.38720  ORF Transcript_8589/g.38720 Transcript_8589/m.38720 type:complete len:254 (-) Transcript_8589:1049-1810(-)